MAYRLSLLCLATLTTVPLVAAAAITDIPSEILNFVPSCAQSCFSSFISANFDAGICGNSPSLECLCRQVGSSGYTIGEGALSCLYGESRFGACEGQDGISDAVQTAYHMCVGISSAAPETHSTIVATLVVPQSGTGPLLVPTTMQTSTTTKSATTGFTSSKPTPTVSLPSGNEPTSTSSVSASETSAAPTSTSTASPATSGSQPQLSSAQIVGIALGGLAVVVFGILLVLMARCIRRKRFGDMESGFSKMRDSMSFGKKSRPSSAPGMQITSPLPRLQAERNPMDPRWQPSLPTEGVGLAIAPMPARGGVFASPPPARISALAAPLPPTPAAEPVRTIAPARAARSVPTVVLTPASETQTPNAGQGPPKPALTLAIPKGVDRVVRPPPSARDSVVTEFAEDGEGDVAPGTIIWRPPATDPQSATTYYFADKSGNWILRNASTRRPEASAPTGPAIQEVAAEPVEVELPSPDHKTRAERARDAYGGFSPDAAVSPLRLPRKPGNPKLGSPIAFRDQRREPQYSSPSLSERLSQTAETMGTGPARGRKQPPKVYFTAVREARDLTGGKGRRRSLKRASRRTSQDSATSIESGVAGPFEGEDAIEDEPQVDLSPVVESPQTPISPGKSPVTYPKIRKPNGGQAPREPGLLPSGQRYNVWHPPGQSSPTGAGSEPPKTRKVTPSPPAAAGPYAPSKKPWNAPNLQQPPLANRNPAQLRTGSPETRQGPMSQAQYLQRQRQVANPASYWNDQSQLQPQPQVAPARAPARPPPPPTPPYELPGEKYSSPKPQATTTRARGVGMVATPPQPRRAPGPPRPTDLPTPQSTPGGPSTNTIINNRGNTTITTANPTSSVGSQSSLLAKRRGADKAAALALDSSRAGSSTAPSRRRKQGNHNGWTREEEENNSPVPITPGWVPELTPSRRGEDLFLDVR